MTREKVPCGETRNYHQMIEKEKENRKIKKGENKGKTKIPYDAGRDFLEFKSRGSV